MTSRCLEVHSSVRSTTSTTSTSTCRTVPSSDSCTSFKVLLQLSCFFFFISRSYYPRRSPLSICVGYRRWRRNPGRWPLLEKHQIFSRISVTTQVRCGGIFIVDFVMHFESEGEKVLNLVCFWRNLGHEYGDAFLTHSGQGWLFCVTSNGTYARVCISTALLICLFLSLF